MDLGASSICVDTWPWINEQRPTNFLKPCSPSIFQVGSDIVRNPSGGPVCEHFSCLLGRLDVEQPIPHRD